MGGFVVRNRTGADGFVLSTLQPISSKDGALRRIQHMPINVCLATMAGGLGYFLP